MAEPTSHIPQPTSVTTATPQASTPPPVASTIRIDHCYTDYPCDMPDCDGRGSRFALDMRRGITLGHYCEAHSEADIRAYWRELERPDAIQPFYRERPEERLVALFRDLGAQLVDVTDAGGSPHLDQRRGQAEEEASGCEVCGGALDPEPLVCECGMLLCEPCYARHQEEAQ